MWEDEKNKAGGRWVLQSGKKNMIGSPGNEQPALDLYWLEVNFFFSPVNHFSERVILGFSYQF